MTRQAGPGARRRVLVLTTWFPDADTPNVAPFIVRHARALAADHDVQVVHARLGQAGPAEHGTWEGLNVARIGFDPKRPVTLARFRRLAQPFLAHADLLHTMAFSSLVPALTLRKTVPWVHTEHWSGVADPASVGPGWERLSGLRRLLGRPDVVTAVSEPFARQIRALRPGPVEVVPNIVPVEESPRLPKEPAAGPRVVAVGSLLPGKDPLVALEAFARAFPDTGTLTWIGDGPLRAEVEGRAAGLGLLEGERPRFTLTGLLDPAEVARRLGAADLFVLPTRGETFCVSLVEALAAGLPAVVTDLPATRAIVEDLSTRVRVPAELVPSEPEDTRAERFAAALVRARGMDAPAPALSEAVCELYGAATVTRRFNGIYDSLRA